MCQDRLFQKQYSYTNFDICLAKNWYSRKELHPHVSNYSFDGFVVQGDTAAFEIGGNDQTRTG